MKKNYHSQFWAWWTGGVLIVDANMRFIQSKEADELKPISVNSMYCYYRLRVEILTKKNCVKEKEFHICQNYIPALYKFRNDSYPIRMFLRLFLFCFAFINGRQIWFFQLSQFSMILVWLILDEDTHTPHITKLQLLATIEREKKGIHENHQQQ